MTQSFSAYVAEREGQMIDGCCSKVKINKELCCRYKLSIPYHKAHTRCLEVDDAKSRMHCSAAVSLKGRSRLHRTPLVYQVPFMARSRGSSEES